ncbi:MAG: zinc-ribbon domain-containing protein [Nanoarchaeota archaeon]|nr:zinc-ribbon domain-containing protein [Nanoarchaeota archaeon]
MFESIVDHWVGQIVGAVISVVIGIWVLSLFSVDVVGFVKRLFGKEKTVVILVRCSSCGKKNPENAKHCLECGKEL